MSSNTALGIFAGSIIGVGSAVSPLGDMPSIFFLGLRGVSNPTLCLNWMKDPTEATISNPCSPVTDIASLSLVSGVLVFIAIGLIVWAGIEQFGKSKTT
jgi:hypothetical protein